MPLYRQNGQNMAQLAQSAMSGAAQSASSMQKARTVETRKETDLLDDIGKAANITSAALNATDKGWQLYDRYRERSAYENISKAYQEGGMEAIENNPDLQDYWHTRAAGMFFRDRANNEKGLAEMTANLDARVERDYQDWRVKAFAARDAYQKNNMEAYAAAMEDLAGSSPMPYRLKSDGQGNFRELFRSDKDMGWVETGRSYSSKQAYELMNGILSGETTMLRGAEMKPTPYNERFNLAAKRHMMATNMTNYNNRIDPKTQMPLYDQNGRLAAIGVRQDRLDDYNAPPYLLAYDAKTGKHLGNFTGLDELARGTGLSPWARTQSGGRAASGRRRARGGGPGGRVPARTDDTGAQGGRPQYRVSASDMTAFEKESKYTDETTGEDRINRGKAATLALIQRNTGRDRNAVIHAYNEAKKFIMDQRGVSEEAAERMAIDLFNGKFGGGKAGPKQAAPKSAPTQSGGEPAAPKAKTPQEIKRGEAEGRIVKAYNNPPRKDQPAAQWIDPSEWGEGIDPWEW